MQKTGSKSRSKRDKNITSFQEGKRSNSMKAEREEVTPMSTVVKQAETDMSMDNSFIDKQMLPPSKLGINDFDIVKVIGRGTFGKVYLVKKKPNGSSDDG